METTDAQQRLSIGAKTGSLTRRVVRAVTYTTLNVDGIFTRANFVPFALRNQQQRSEVPTAPPHQPHRTILSLLLLVNLLRTVLKKRNGLSTSLFS